MKVLVMGAGGVGGFYAGVLNKHDHDITIVARGEHAKAIKSYGLQIKNDKAGENTGGYLRYWVENVLEKILEDS